jgi:alanyl aminopeptidase
MLMDVRDPHARARAADLAATLVGNEADAKPDAVEPQLADLVLAVAVQENGALVFDRLVDELMASSDATERNRVLSALGHAEDPVLARRALELTLDPRVRANEIGRLLGPQFRNPRTRPDAWAWFKSNFDEIAARFGGQQVGGIPWYTASFCSEEAAQEVEAFFAPKVADLFGGPRNLAGAVEAISLCAALAEAQRPSIERAFREKGDNPLLRD